MSISSETETEANPSTYFPLYIIYIWLKIGKLMHMHRNEEATKNWEPIKKLANSNKSMPITEQQMFTIYKKKKKMESTKQNVTVKEEANALIHWS